LKVFWTRFSTI